MTIDRKTIAVVAVGLALGWWLGSSPSSPVNPHPQPDRPVLRAFGRVARLAARAGLWFALAGENAPERPQSPDRKQAQQGDERQLVRSKAPAIGADGLQELDHAEGW